MPQKLSHTWQSDHSYQRCTAGTVCHLDVCGTASRALAHVGCSFKENTDPSGGAPGRPVPVPLLIPGHPRWRCCSEAQLPRHPCQHPCRSLGSLSLGSHRGRASTFHSSSCSPVEFGAVSTLSLVNFHYTEVILMYSCTVCWYTTVQAE